MPLVSLVPQWHANRVTRGEGCINPPTGRIREIVPFPYHIFFMPSPPVYPVYPICASRASPRCPFWPSLHKSDEICPFSLGDWGMCCAPKRAPWPSLLPGAPDMCTAIRSSVSGLMSCHISPTLRRSAQSYRLRANARYQGRRCAAVGQPVLITELCMAASKWTVRDGIERQPDEQTSQSQA